jgi:hypothetical protein
MNPLLVLFGLVFMIAPTVLMAVVLVIVVRGQRRIEGQLDTLMSERVPERGERTA